MPEMWAHLDMAVNQFHAAAKCWPEATSIEIEAMDHSPRKSEGQVRPI
jgi:hypothetical protein